MASRLLWFLASKALRLVEEPGVATSTSLIKLQGVLSLVLLLPKETVNSNKPDEIAVVQHQAYKI